MRAEWLAAQAAAGLRQIHLVMQGFPELQGERWAAVSWSEVLKRAGAAPHVSLEWVRVWLFVVVPLPQVRGRLARG